jgi:hypothetical protein
LTNEVNYVPPVVNSQLSKKPNRPVAPYMSWHFVSKLSRSNISKQFLTDFYILFSTVLFPEETAKYNCLAVCSFLHLLLLVLEYCKCYIPVVIITIQRNDCSIAAKYGKKPPPLLLISVIW